MLKPTLETLFQKVFGPKTTQSAPPVNFGNIEFGHNSNLLGHLTTAYASNHKHIPSFSEYEDCLNGKLAPPVPPKKSDYAFAPKLAQLAQFDGPEWNNQQGLLHEVITQCNFIDAQKIYHDRYHRYEKMAQRSRLVAQAHNGGREGYRSFLCDPNFQVDDLAFPSSFPPNDRAFFISAPKFQFRESDRQRHTYITAGTGHGKSVTIERLIYHYVTQGYSKNLQEKPCVILLDPHGDLAEAVAQFKVSSLNDNLAYIKPALSNTITPTLNPLDLKSKNWDDIALATDAFIEVFRDIMQRDKDGTSFSPQMVTILKPCLATLLHMDHTTLADLMPFLSDERADYEPYINHARRHLTNPSQLEFLQKDFFKDSYNPSKLSIKTKIRNLLSDDFFYNFLCGSTTFDLEKLIATRAVILFDLSDLTDTADKDIGRFVMATLTRFAFSQGNQPFDKRIPIHLFVDECQDFISDSMQKIVTHAQAYICPAVYRSWLGHL